MAIKSFALGAILVLAIATTESSAQYWNNRYMNPRHYQHYPQYQHQRPYQPPQGGYQQQGFQLPAGVSLSDAEWVCKNPKTGDMMIIELNDGPIPNRVNPPEEGQWHQIYPQQPGNNQQSYPEPQNPGVYPQAPVTNPPPLITTTEDTYRPIWGEGQNGQNQPGYPQGQTQVTSKPTTEDPYRPIWGDGGSSENRPVYPQTQAPVTSKPTTVDPNQPAWSDGGSNVNPNFPQVSPVFPTSTSRPLWPNDDSQNKPGFTVIEPTPKPPKPTQASIDDDDDDGPIQIVMG